MIKKIFSLLFLLLLPVLVHTQYRHGYLYMGKLEMQKQNYTRAIQFFNSAIQGLPDYFEGYYLRGLAKYNLDDMAGAENDFTRAISCLPKFPRLYMVRGVARAEQLKPEKAIEDFNQAIRLDSNYTDAFFYRSITNMQLYNYEEALADCKAVIKQNPDYNGIYILEGLVQFYMGQYEKAIADYTKSIQRDSANLRTYVERGRAYTELMQIDSAMQDFEYVLSVDSSNAYAYFNRAVAKMNLLNYEAALEDLNKVIELAPDYELAYFNRALLKRSENQENEALQDFHHLLRQNPDNMLVYYNLGITLHNLGHFKKAIKCFNAAIELFPDYADAYQKRAQSRNALGDVSGAQRDLDTYRALNQKNMAKSDTLKYRQGLEIMRLTRLSSDFTSREERKHKIQYQDAELELIPIFRLITDANATQSINRYYQTGNLYFRFENRTVINEINPGRHDSLRQKIDELNQIINTNPLNAELYLRRGLMLSQLNEFNVAIANFDTAIVLNKHYALAYFCRGNAGIGKIDQKLSRQSSNLINPSANNSELLRAYSDVIYDYSRALKQDSNLVFARFNLGYANYLMEDYTAAINEFSQIANQLSMAEAYFNQALILLYLKRKQEACEMLGLAGQTGLEKAYAIIRKFCK
ncbi:MAG: tetratricopeptide repeat protein [Bacteroidetes bacterium]|jgi:tetratricopeptide (TPR) repeat protein|nr:tetratricopeptide repeat protein [Bacteroidota bacterium]